MRKIIVHTAIGAAAVFVFGMMLTWPTEAAQAWSCICNGERKRYLASTRHCEFKNDLPKGAWCSAAQWRAVYGPACREKGCVLPPLR